MTTGTGSAKPISFKISTDDRQRGEALAAERGVGVNELAKRAFLAVVRPPTGD
jgi:hypothetical protein